MPGKKINTDLAPASALPPSRTAALQNDNSSDTLFYENLRKLYTELEKEQLLSNYSFPTKPSSDGFYHVYVADPTRKSGRKAIKAKNLDNLRQKVYEHERGINGRGRKTFKDVFEIVQQEKIKYVKDPEKLISINNTIVANKANYRRFLGGTAFENKYVDEITKEDIHELCLNTLRENDLNKKAFFKLRGIINSVMRFSYEQYWILDNPYTRIDFRKYNDMLVRETPISQRVHSSDEIDRMLGYLHAKQLDQPSYIPAYALELQILMGLRRAEIAPLEWADVNETGIRISKEQLLDMATRACTVVSHTKTYVERVFPVTDDIGDFLDRLRHVHDKYYPDSIYLFPDPSQKTGMINNNVVYRLYSRMCNKLGIKISRDTIKGPHSFRRNGITKVCNATGGNIYLASILYGNSPLSASKHYYTGINLAEAKDILEGNQG